MPVELESTLDGSVVVHRVLGEDDDKEEEEETEEEEEEQEPRLKVGDVIMDVDHVAVGDDLELALRLLKGPPDTHARITISRAERDQRPGDGEDAAAALVVFAQRVAAYEPEDEDEDEDEDEERAAGSPKGGGSSSARPDGPSE